MPLFRVHVTRTQYLTAEVEADDEQDARDRAAAGDVDTEWQDATGGRGVGDDDYIVTDVEHIDDDNGDDEP
jgi:hypothetical protein